MKIRYIKLQNWLIASVMSIFGLSACHCHKDAVDPDNKTVNRSSVRDEEPVKLMYGGPERNYRVLQPAEDNKAQINILKSDNEPVEPREPQVTVYGVPTADFAVKGRVVNASGKPIKGIQVSLLKRDYPDNALPPQDEWNNSFLKEATDTTDNNGSFEIKVLGCRPWDQMKVVMRDIDGAKNGKYQQQSMDVEFGEPEAEDGENVNKWRQGVKHAEITVKMKTSK